MGSDGYNRDVDLGLSASQVDEIQDINKLFKTTFVGGYDKESVLNYIRELQYEYRKDKARLAERYLRAEEEKKEIVAAAKEEAREIIKKAVVDYKKILHSYSLIEKNIADSKNYYVAACDKMLEDIDNAKREMLSPLQNRSDE